MDRIVNNKNLTIFGDGNQTRDFLFAEDAALANMLALKTKNKIFNIGSGKPTSINELHGELKKLFNKEIEIDYSEPLEEIRKMYLDISLAKKQLEWEPKTELKEGIKEIMKLCP